MTDGIGGATGSGPALTALTFQPGQGKQIANALAQKSEEGRARVAAITQDDSSNSGNPSKESLSAASEQENKIKGALVDRFV